MGGSNNNICSSSNNHTGIYYFELKGVQGVLVNVIVTKERIRTYYSNSYFTLFYIFLLYIYFKIIYKSNKLSTLTVSHVADPKHSLTDSDSCDTVSGMCVKNNDDDPSSSSSSPVPVSS